MGHARGSAAEGQESFREGGSCCSQDSFHQRKGLDLGVREEAMEKGGTMNEARLAVGCGLAQWLGACLAPVRPWAVP